MASISKATASVLSGTQEIALALANLNFDFSLVKLEAPQEFHALGASLSKPRRQAAEYGRTHVTARKLGALFEHVVPRTPKLVEVYGKRTSELARSTEINPQATPKDGIFSDFTGADGTSIWAAATSGSCAISVHLLACMLARIWTAAEATSIWVEIVEARKKQLLQTVDSEPLSLPMLLAAQVVLDREQLAEWDNSARAWLRRADEGKKKEQTQLMLILNNLSIPVNSKFDTYSSVMFALKTALLAMEELLEGRPQSVQDGSLLLALSCWHIYPDLIILGNRTVKQSDQLVPHNAKLTVGLESSPSLKSTGVRWSLSLAHMRYYGPAITSERSLGTSSTRMTIHQLMLVALGSILENWDYKALDSLEASSVILSVYDCFLTQSKRKSNFPVSKQKSVKNEQIGLRDLDDNWKKNFYSGPNWVRALRDAAHSLHTTRTPDQEMLMRLVSLGRGSGSSFLAQKGHYPPAVFGLADFEGFIGTLDTDEDRIAILRKYASRFFPNALPGKVIIRYYPDSPRKAEHSSVEDMPSKVGLQALWQQSKELEAQALHISGKDETSAPESQDLDQTDVGSSDCKEPESCRDKVRRSKHLNVSEAAEEPPTKKSRQTPRKRRRKAPTGRKKSATAKKSRGAVLEAQNFQNNENTSDDLQNTDVKIVPTFSIQVVEESQPENMARRTLPFEYATALPVATSPSSSLQDKTYHHYRWIDHRNLPYPIPKRSIFEQSEVKELVLPKSSEMFGLDPVEVDKPTFSDKTQNSSSEAGESVVTVMYPTLSLQNPKTFETYDVQDDKQSKISSVETTASAGDGINLSEYEFFLGDSEIAAIYVSKDLHEAFQTEARLPYWATKRKQRKKRVDIEDMRTALDSGAISAQSLDTTLRHQDRFHHTTSLLALAALQETYEELHGATIDPNIILEPFHTANCLDGFSGSYVGVGYQTKSLDRERAFACITLMETGSLNLSVNHFQNVIAVASGDSLYVASQLLLDPGAPEMPQKVHRIVGNVGRPGVSLLVPPAELQCLKAQPGNWCLINRTPYDGVQTDSFSDTSLHLSFTGWSTTVDTGPAAQGQRDVEASLVEAVVSVHDRGKWIADIDILTALKKGHSQFDHRYYFKCCTHRASSDQIQDEAPLSPSLPKTNMAPDIAVQGLRSENSNGQSSQAEVDKLINRIPFISIDNWEEFLDRPSGPCVVRAHKNRLARLATTVLSVDRGDRVLVGDKVCWQCCADLHDIGGEDIIDKITFVT